MRNKEFVAITPFAFLMISSFVKAQNCNCPPSAIAGLVHRVNTIYYDKVECKDWNGETSCVFACNYVLSSNSAYEIIVSAVWVKNVKPATGYKCNIMPQGYSIGSPTKLAWGKTFLSRYREDLAEEAKKLARDLIQQVEPYTAPCPGMQPPKDDINFGDLDGAFRTVSGDVWIITPDGKKNMAVNGTALYRGCKIMTGKNSIARIEINSTVNKNADVPENEKEVLIVDLGENSEVDLRDLMANENMLQEIQNRAEKNRTVFDMIKGTIHWLSQNWKRNSIFRMQDGAAIWVRGTEFIASYSPQSKTGTIYLNEGKMDFKNINTGQSSSLSSWQTMTIQNGAFSEPGYMPLAMWEEQLAMTGFSKSAQSENQAVRYKILFEGKQYSTFLEKQEFEGKPIDVYYYEIYDVNKAQAEQNGEKLYGRFVRVPSADYFDQSNVVWFHKTWIFNGSNWITRDKEKIKVELLW